MTFVKALSWVEHPFEYAPSIGHNPPRFSWSLRAARPFGLEARWQLAVDRRPVGDVQLIEDGGLAYVGRVQGRALGQRFATRAAACSAVEEAYRDLRWGG